VSRQRAVLAKKTGITKPPDTVGESPCAVTTHNTLRVTRIGFGGHPRGQPPYLTLKG